MATKSYKWFFDLTENLLTKDVTNDYIATVKTLLPKTVDNLADDIVKETAYNRETVIGVITLYDKKIIESVCQGNTVNTGSTLYAPALPGSFIGTDGVEMVFLLLNQQTEHWQKFTVYYSECVSFACRMQMIHIHWKTERHRRRR